MGFSSVKNKKRSIEKKKNKKEKRNCETQSFEIHFVRTTVSELLFHNNHFRKRVLLEESILTKVCYWVSSRLCTGLSFCTNQGVFSTFLDPV